MYIPAESMFTNALESSYAIQANDLFIAALVGFCSTPIDV